MSGEAAAEGAAAEAAAPKICGVPACKKRENGNRLILIPSSFKGERFPGAKHYHQQRAPCWRYILGIEKQKPGRKRKAATGDAGRIPVGAIVCDDPCPPIIQKIHEVWASRHATASLLSARLLTGAFVRAGRATLRK